MHPPGPAQHDAERVSSLRLRSWRWWRQAIRVASVFVVASAVPYSLAPGDLHVAPRVAYGLAILVGVIGGIWWHNAAPRELHDRLTACAVVMVIFAVAAILPLGHMALSVLGPAFQLGMIGGVVLAAAAHSKARPSPSDL